MTVFLPPVSVPDAPFVLGATWAGYFVFKAATK